MQNCRNTYHSPKIWLRCRVLTWQSVISKGGIGICTGDTTAVVVESKECPRLAIRSAPNIRLKHAHTTGRAPAACAPHNAGILPVRTHRRKQMHTDREPPCTALGASPMVVIVSRLSTCSARNRTEHIWWTTCCICIPTVLLSDLRLSV